MTTSQIQTCRLLGFYRIQPPHRPRGQALFTSLSPCHSLFCFFINLKHTHFHITHSFCLLRPDSGCRRWKWQIISGVISMGDTSSQPPHTLLPSSSLHFIAEFFFFFFPSVCQSLTHTLIRSVTSLSVNIASLSAWQSEHKSPPSVNTLTVKTVVPRASNKKT